MSTTTMAEIQIVGDGIDPLYCVRLLARVELVAGCRAKENIIVVVRDQIDSGFIIPISETDGIPTLGLYEQGKRTVTVIRDRLCPWLLAHEFAHVIYCDNYLSHPESWADTSADATVGKMPKWLNEPN
jgi:hypothetical protein